jgi:hypothetical protein
MRSHSYVPEDERQVAYRAVLLSGRMTVGFCMVARPTPALVRDSGP